MSTLRWERTEGARPLSPVCASGLAIAAGLGPGSTDRDRDAPESRVDFSPDLTMQLDVLTEALDGNGDDLRTILSVLFDDLAVGISSFVGLSVTVSGDGEPVTMTAMNSTTAAASVLLPLTPGTQAGHVVLYAQNPGAFIDLAADARIALGSGGDIVVDGHLPPPTASAAQRSLDAVTDRSTINQALGFLIGHGYPGGRQSRFMH